MKQIDTLGALLKEQRISRGWSRAELAKRTGLNANTIAKYEKAGEEGGQYPSMPKLAALAAFYGLDGRRILALCAENSEDAKRLLKSADSEIAAEEQNTMGLVVVGISLLMAMFSSSKENQTAISEVISYAKELNPSSEEIDKMAELMKNRLIQNEEPEEASLVASSSGSNSTTLTEKRKDDEWSSD